MGGSLRFVNIGGGGGLGARSLLPKSSAAKLAGPAAYSDRKRSERGRSHPDFREDRYDSEGRVRSPELFNEARADEPGKTMRVLRLFVVSESFN